jgi:hypothetical protein
MKQGYRAQLISGNDGQPAEPRRRASGFGVPNLGRRVYHPIPFARRDRLELGMAAWRS